MPRAAARLRPVPAGVVHGRPQRRLRARAGRLGGRSPDQRGKEQFRSGPLRVFSATRDRAARGLQGRPGGLPRRERGAQLGDRPTTSRRAPGARSCSRASRSSPRGGCRPSCPTCAQERFQDQRVRRAVKPRLSTTRRINRTIFLRRLRADRQLLRRDGARLHRPAGGAASWEILEEYRGRIPGPASSSRSTPTRWPATPVARREKPARAVGC